MTDKLQSTVRYDGKRRGTGTGRIVQVRGSTPPNVFYEMTAGPPGPGSPFLMAGLTLCNSVNLYGMRTRRYARLGEHARWDI